ncbi:MAG: sigma-54-dependent Fis family transcriptional regulator [Bacteroidales bacterium]|nr:sigma-54-dependent Fis family transcriptional regulator [Bacteroidales bacterium]
MSKKEGAVLIVDDNEELLIAYEIFLSPHFQTIKTLSNPNVLPAALNESAFDVILLDMNFSAGINTGNEGFFWMNKILEIDPDASIILITAYGDVEQAIRAIREGASDFILKSWDREKILSTILAAYQLRRSKLEIRNLKSKQQHLIDHSNRDFDFCHGSTQKMMDLLNTVGKVAPTDANILILGENGTGKEVLARDIHAKSLRCGEIFVGIDVGSISETVFESELFGHMKGSFTDAVKDKPGRIEIASGGTLFLDEIGNLPLSLQAKLLSVTEKKEVCRVGSNQVIPVDVRLICATNSNLYQLCEEGQFREDLLYRINNIQLDLPPLRERPEDIPQLVAFFIDKFAVKYAKPGLKVSKHAIHQLSKNIWKGNIRELRNVVEKAVLLSEGALLKPADFVTNMGSREMPTDVQEFNLEENEKMIILRALKAFGNNKKLTARELGINRTTLYNKMRKHGFESL